MQSLILNSTDKTPSIEFNTDTGLLTITGRSLPEHPFESFRPLIALAEEYCRIPHDKTTINIWMDYFNSGTSKCLFEILRKFDGVWGENNSVVINWHYEEDDEDTLQIIETYEELLSIPINKFIVKQL